MLSRDDLQMLLTNAVEGVANQYSQQATTSIGPDNKLRVWFYVRKNSISIELRFDDAEDSVLIMAINSGRKIVNEELIPFDMNDYDFNSFNQMLLRHLGAFNSEVIQPNTEIKLPETTVKAHVDININPIAAKLRAKGFTEQDDYSDDIFEFVKLCDDDERIVFILNYSNNTVIKRCDSANEFLLKSSTESFTVKNQLAINAVLAVIR